MSNSTRRNGQDTKKKKRTETIRFLVTEPEQASGHNRSRFRVQALQMQLEAQRRHAYTHSQQSSKKLNRSRVYIVEAV